MHNFRIVSLYYKYICIIKITSVRIYNGDFFTYTVKKIIMDLVMFIKKK